MLTRELQSGGSRAVRWMDFPGKRKAGRVLLVWKMQNALISMENQIRLDSPLATCEETLDRVSAAFQESIFGRGDGNAGDTQSSPKSWGIGVSRPLHLQRQRRRRDWLRPAGGAAGFTPEPLEEKVAHKELRRNGPRLD